MTENSAPPLPGPPIDLLGGEEVVRRLSRRFYDFMEEREPALTAVHRHESPGRIHPEARERFALFFIEWLGGRRDYSARHGHPRLRMRHGHVPVTTSLATAWLRCMGAALDEEGVSGDLRAFLEERLRHLAHFLRNAAD